MVSETNSARDQATADLERARVDVEAARADLEVAKADEREAQVLVEYGQIKAPYDGVITQRNVSPGDYLQPGGGTNGRPLFVLEQTDPVRVFVGVPELASFFIHDGDTALIRFQAIPGVTREGKVVRSGFSLNPSTRTLQTEIDIPNADGHLHPGWYVTVTIAIDRKQVWTLPSDAIGFQGQQNYYRLPPGRRQARPHAGHHRPVRRHAHRGPQEVRPRRQYQRLADVRRHRARPRGQPRRPRRSAACDRAGGAALNDRQPVTGTGPHEPKRLCDDVPRYRGGRATDQVRLGRRSRSRTRVAGSGGDLDDDRVVTQLQRE